MKLATNLLPALTASLCVASMAGASEMVVDFEDLAEGAYGIPYTHQGISYHDLNNVSGVFPNGDTFDPQPDDEVIIEDATLFYNDYPGWGSPDKLLTFGTAFVVGDNLSLGRLSTVMMDLPETADSVSMDVGFYENGPWGGIEIHLDAIMDNAVVGSDSFVLSDLGGRDNTNVEVLSVSGVEFNQLHMYATYGSEYSLPRVIIDDITLNYLSGNASLSVDPEPLTAGRDATFDVTGATPNAPTFLGYSLQGTGSTYVGFLNVTVDLKAPKQAGSMKLTDANGDVQWVLGVPAGAAGRNIWFQAAQFENKTNVLATFIQ